MRGRARSRHTPVFAAAAPCAAEPSLLSYDSSLTLSKTEKGLPLAVANTKEKGKVVCNWVGGAAEADQAVLTLTFTNAATKSYTFKVSGAKVTDQEL